MKHDFTLSGLVGAVAVVAVMAASVPVLAGSDSDEKYDDDNNAFSMPYGGGAFGHMNLMGMRVDDNADGIITASEASRHASTAFAFFDGDADGQISMDEFLDSAPAAMPMGRRNQERRYVNRTARFKAMDGDGDDTVTLAEFMSKVQANYDAADANADGKVTIWEFRAQRNPF